MISLACLISVDAKQRFCAANKKSILDGNGKAMIGSRRGMHPGKLDQQSGEAAKIHPSMLKKQELSRSKNVVRI